LDETIERIADNPTQFRLVRSDTRRAIVNRFPYAVYFRLDGNDIVVLAVHGRQHPRRWNITTVVSVPPRARSAHVPQNHRRSARDHVRTHLIRRDDSVII
jgi:hypothetical protein